MEPRFLSFLLVRARHVFARPSGQRKRPQRRKINWTRVMGVRLPAFVSPRAAP